MNNEQSAEALSLLMRLPDPPELDGKRAYRYTAPRRPHEYMRAEIIKVALECAYWRHYVNELRDVSCVVSRRGYVQ